MEATPRKRALRASGICILLIFISCNTPNRKSAENPAETYRKIKDQIVRHELQAAQAAAKKAWLQHPNSESGWRFKLQYAKVLLLSHQTADARSILAAPLPSGYFRLQPEYDYLQAYLSLQEHRSSAPTALRAVVAEAHAKSDPELEANALISLWFADREAGSKSDGNATLEQARDIANRNHLDYQEAVSLTDLGYLALSKNQYAAAIPYLQQAALHAKRIQAVYIQAAASQNVGECFFQLGDFGRALGPLLEAQKLLPPNDPSEAAVKIKNELGTYFSLTRQNPAALHYYREAFALAQLGSPTSDWYILSSLNLASELLQTHSIDQAEKYNEIASQAARKTSQKIPAEWIAAIELNRADIAAQRAQPQLAVDSYRKALQILSKEPPNFTQVLAYAGLAEVEEQLHKTNEARKNFEKALRSIESNRSRQVSAQYQIKFLSALIRFYQRYVNFLLRQNQPWMALAVADSSRASVLAEGSVSSREEPDFLLRVRKEARAAASILLFYWIAPDASYVWVVSPTHSDFKKLPSSQEKIEQDVRSYSSFIQNERQNTAASANPVGLRLYDTLIGPVASYLQPGMPVIVVPDGALHGLNFETLLVKGERIHYWVQDATVIVAPSLELLLTAHRSRVSSERALIIGDPIYSGQDYPPLPESKREVESVSAHFPVGRKVLTRSQAVADAFKEAHPERFSLIHFSAHVDANPQSPLDSAIILSPGADGSRQLYARDVMNTHLNADLVTISGCRSAGSTELSGEGMVGFAWASFKAGASNAVTSLWAVDDTSTTDLMDRFYAGVTAGKAYATALRDAKLQMLQTPFKQPFYWAPFQLYSRNIAESR